MKSLQKRLHMITFVCFENQFNHKFLVQALRTLVTSNFSTNAQVAHDVHHYESSLFGLFPFY